MFLSVLIPMYNEASIVSQTAAALWETLEAWALSGGHTFEILFSDDGSQDGCGALVQAFAADHQTDFGKVRLVTASQNAGKGHAVGLAMAAAEGEYALYTDCDLAYGTEILPKMAENTAAWQCDICIGSRNLSKDGYAEYTFLRKLASRAYLRILAVLVGFHLSDSQCGCKCFRRDIGKTLFAANQTNGWAFDIEILSRATRRGAVIREMPVTILHHRASKIHLVQDSLRMFRDVLRIRRRLRQEAAAFPDST